MIFSILVLSRVHSNLLVGLKITFNLLISLPLTCLYLDINEHQSRGKNDLLIFFIKTVFTSNMFAETYSKPCQTSKMEAFAKIVNSLKTLIVFCKKLHLGCLTGLGICLCITRERKESCSLQIPRYWKATMKHLPHFMSMELESINFTFEKLSGMSMLSKGKNKNKTKTIRE